MFWAAADLGLSDRRAVPLLHHTHPQTDTPDRSPMPVLTELLLGGW